jgi:proteasome lid subunit RPN8/RPN11
MTCVIPPEVVEAIRGHAAAHYPREACGLLVGRDEPDLRRVARAVPARNRAPEEHRYTIAPEDFLRAEREARLHGLDVIGFYHSHPDAGPAPSRTDRRAAWPHYTYLIVAVSAGAAGSLRGFRRVGNDLEPEPLRLADGEARG